MTPEFETQLQNKVTTLSGVSRFQIISFYVKLNEPVRFIVWNSGGRGDWRASKSLQERVKTPGNTARKT